MPEPTRQLIVASVLAFGVLAIPGFAAFVEAIGGDAEIMQKVVGAYAVYHILWTVNPLKKDE